MKVWHPTHISRHIQNETNFHLSDLVRKTKVCISYQHDASIDLAPRSTGWVI
uniref:Uncharacterized protein n=1 Tax=Anguilla anguilla TaxID=7936 RepID=A0A0E9Q6Q7_ANGAN